ncbi:PREDICTED: Fc receptor-like protein 3 [Galeopterus variegatus]|uniref:Fc receptor-like protein 3 n=1 Tax=Galeopterus variegatus TaxID=482537 RepID=A0ABM0S2C3_GALVR|nr:PREDICTED: Fc receptor-like protein 3 [Galeopterus variegatus]
MHLRLLLLLILGVPPKAVLFFSPPWSPTFEGESVTLTCRESHFPAREDVYWYYNGNSFKKSKVIQIRKSGHYQCKTQRSSLSDAVHVEFSSDWLILQAPHPVFEGDNVVLKCQGKDENKISERNYYKNGERLDISKNSNSILLTSVSRDDSVYQCSASGKYLLRQWKKTSKHLRIQVQELFPSPVLTASPSLPTEGSPMTLTCETQLSPQRPDVQLQFRFFRDVHVLGSGWSSSAELQIPATWSEDSGSYWCEAETMTPSIVKRSQRFQIHVQRVPVSDVNLEIQPPGGQLVEGENLILICSVAKGTGTITFSWHREGIVRSVGRKTQSSLMAELQIPNMKEHNAGRYYCAADNTYGPIISKRITVTVRIPVSRPVLTLRMPRTQAVVGDMVEFHCEALRGSPPILYEFYHENVNLERSSAPSGGGVSFKLSLTTEYSGNYSCEADNGLGVQHSHRVSLKVTVPVSRPVLTLRAPGVQAVVGNMVELHCEALRGSPPILYWFYHENVTLGNSSAPSGGGAYFNLSLTAKHSGNFSCEAANGLGAQRSEAVTLKVTGTSRIRTGLTTAGVIGGLLSILGLATTAALLGHLRTQRRLGGTFYPLSLSSLSHYSPKECPEPSSSRPFSTDPPNPLYSEPPTQMALQPVYSNVNPGDSNLVYSQIWSFQHTKENSANSPRVHREDEEPAVFYSELKKVQPGDSAGQTSSSGSVHEDDTENYENVPCASSVSAH